MVYTGDEVGAQFSPYIDNRPISWKDPHGLRPFYRRLIAVRHELPSLWSKTWHPFEDLIPANVLAYVRSAPGQAPVLVVLNPNGKAKNVRIEMPGAYASLARAGRLHDVLNGETIATGGGPTVAVAMPRWGARVLVAPGGEGR
jgi:hypothetical protein